MDFLIFHCINGGARGKGGPLSFRVTEVNRKKKQSLSRKRTAASLKLTLVLLRLPRVIQLFPQIGMLQSPRHNTHWGLTGGDKSDQSKLEGVSAVGDSAHTHTQAGVEHYETLAVFGLLAAVLFGSTQAFVCSCMHGSIQQQLPAGRA